MGKKRKGVTASAIQIILMCTYSAFLKIDVDQYNEDNYREEDGAEANSPPIGPDDKEITNLLIQGKNLDALKLVLRNAPVTSRNQMVKDAALSIVIKVLLSVKSAQMEEAVSALDREQLDILMKYIYRGFESPSEGSSGHL